MNASHGPDRQVEVLRETLCALLQDDPTLEPRDVTDLLRPADDGLFEAVPIADLVNKVANTGPEIQERFVAKDTPQPEKSGHRKVDDSQMTLF